MVGSHPVQPAAVVAGARRGKAQDAQAGFYQKIVARVSGAHSGHDRYRQCTTSCRGGGDRGGKVVVCGVEQGDKRPLSFHQTNYKVSDVRGLLFSDTYK